MIKVFKEIGQKLLKNKDKIGIVLILIGIMIISAAIFMRFQGYRKQQQLVKKFEQGFKNLGDTSNEENTSKKSPSSDKEGAIGLLIIPKINLRVAIGEGIDNETLKYAVGHFEGTALPGEKGNFCLAGHRSYTYSEYFNRLDELKGGDEILIRTKKGEYKYKIIEQKIVEPTEISVLNPTKEPTITLVTCTPIRMATHRLIIKGKLE